MTKRGHRQTGVGIAMIATALTAPRLGWPDAVLIGFIALFASSVPDNLEVKWWWRGERHSLIPHRTVTHWLPFWVIATGWMWINGPAWFSHPVNLVLIGVCAGALGHVLMDWLTPMGVPIGILPWQRHSLHLVRSGGAAEVSAAMVLFVAGLLALASSLGWSLAA